jgi:hypothetical protein
MSQGNENATDDGGDGIQPAGPRKYGENVGEVCTLTRDELLPEWSGHDEDVDDYVELSPDGQAVCDGAFRPGELHRIAEAVMESQRRCAPLTGLPYPPDPAVPPTPLNALHRLRFILGAQAGGEIDGVLKQCEQSFVYQEKLVNDAGSVAIEYGKKLEQAGQKLASVRAVVEAEKRALAAGGTVVNPETIENLATALAE